MMITKKNVIAVVLVSLFICPFLIMLGAQSYKGTAGTIPIRVLHVSSNMNNEIQRIIDDVDAATFFNVTEVSIPQFNVGTPANFSDYDVIVFGVNDGGELRGGYAAVYGRTDELGVFVSNGGGIVWTHDSLEYGNDYGEPLEIPAGVDYEDTGPEVGWDVANARIKVDHEILHYPFELGNAGDLIAKTIGPYSHYDGTTGGQVTNATIVIEHEGTSSIDNFYLTVNEYGSGRVVLDELGHSMGDYGLNLESVKENEVLVNAIYWVSSSENRDIAVTSLKNPKTGCKPMPTIGLGIPLTINITVRNKGEFTESFNVTLSMNDSELEIFLNITLASDNSANLSVVWNTTNAAFGNYTICAKADYVINETNLADNVFSDWIILTVPGDINGDYIVDIFDALLLAAAYNSKPGDVTWNPNADIKDDNTVDIFDAILLANNFNKHVP